MPTTDAALLCWAQVLTACEEGAATAVVRSATGLQVRATGLTSSVTRWVLLRPGRCRRWAGGRGRRTLAVNRVATSATRVWRSTADGLASSLCCVRSTPPDGYVAVGVRPLASAVGHWLALSASCRSTHPTVDSSVLTSSFGPCHDSGVSALKRLLHVDVCEDGHSSGRLARAPCWVGWSASGVLLFVRRPATQAAFGNSTVPVGLDPLIRSGSLRPRSLLAQVRLSRVIVVETPAVTAVLIGLAVGAHRSTHRVFAVSFAANRCGRRGDSLNSVQTPASEAGGVEPV